MSNQNLLKWGYVKVDPEDVRVIDSNELLAQKLGTLTGVGDSDSGQVTEYEPPELTAASIEDGMDALFGEQTPADTEGVYDENSASFGDLETEGLQSEDSFEPGLDPQQVVLGRQQAEEIVSRAEQQAEEIIMQARQQAQTISQQAYEEAKLGGRQDGYQEGMARAQAEIAEKEAQLEQLQVELKQKYQQQLAEMEPYLVAQLSAIYEHLIGVELSQHKSVLMHLIDQTLHNTQAARMYLIHVSEQDYPYVSMQKGELFKEGGPDNATLEVIEDKTLSKNQCLIETESGIFDCSLTVQLEELKRKLLLLAYDQKGV